MTEYQLSFDKNGNPVSRDLIVLTALILVKGANIDNFNSEEMGKISDSLIANFNWNAEQVGDAISMAQILLKDTTRFDSLISKVNESYTAVQKQQLLSLAWKVVLSDNKLSHSEAGFAVNLRKLLQLSIEQAAYARTLAEEKEESPIIAKAIESDDDSF